MSAHGIAGPRRAHAESHGQPDRERHDGPSRPDLRVVEHAHRPEAGRLRFRLAMAAGAAFLAVIVFGLVGLHVMLAQNQFRLDKLNATAAADETRYQRLRLQVDQLESPERIVATAKNKLHMVAAPSVSYLTPSSPVVLTTPPTPPASTSPTTLPNGGPAPADWAEIKPQLAAGQ